MNEKIKKVVCLGFVFIASFLLTISVAAEEDVIVNKNFVGIYKPKNSIPGAIRVDEGEFKVEIYRSADNKYFATGKSHNGKLSGSGSSNFRAVFMNAVKVHSDGSLVDDSPSQSGVQIAYVNFEALGDVTLSPKSIISKENDIQFFKQ